MTSVAPTQINTPSNAIYILDGSTARNLTVTTDQDMSLTPT